MGHDRVLNEHNARVEDAGGAEPGPLLQTGMNEHLLGDDLGLCVLFELGRPQRVTNTAPVMRRVTVAGLGNRTNAYDADLIRVRLSLDSLDDVTNGTNVDLVSKGVVSVSNGGDHATEVDHVVSTVDAALDGLVVSEVTNNDFQVVLGLEFLAEIGVVFVVGGENEGNNVYLVCHFSQ